MSGTNSPPTPCPAPTPNSPNSHVRHQLPTPPTPNSTNSQLPLNVSSSSTIVLGDPVGINTLQADVAIESFSAIGFLSAGLAGRFYNDGTGTRDGEATGDVYATLSLQATSGTATFFVGKCITATCSATQVASGTVPGTGLGSGGHRLLLRWDPLARKFTFGVDGASVVVDPTTVGGSVTSAAAYGGPPRSLTKSLISSVNSVSQGSITSGSVRFSDVFTGL